MWTDRDRDQFVEKISELWPAWGEERYRGLVGFYSRELGSIPVARVCQALERIRRRASRAPEIEDIETEVQYLRGQPGGDSAEKTEREVLVEELRKVATRRGRWFSPKGRECEVTTEGLQFVRARSGEDGQRTCLPWNGPKGQAVTNTELRLILEQATYGQPDSESRMREITFREFAESPAFEERLRAASARGEDTGWLRRLRIRARTREQITAAELVAQEEPGAQG